MKKGLLLITLIIATISLSAQTKRFDVNETFSDVKEVEVDMVFSDVFIEESTTSAVEVTGFVEWEGKKECEIITVKKGSRLIIKAEHPKKLKGDTKGKLYISVPKSIKLELNTVSGNINITDVGKGQVDCNTVSGDIVLTNIACDVELNTVSGDMSATNINGDVETNSVSGDTEINKVSGKFSGNSVSGDFTIRELKGERSISTLSGDVD